jgi:ribosomal protein S18 acetylase RimI-like enzyme
MGHRLNPREKITQFGVKGGRVIVLRPLRRGDLEALTDFARKLAKEKKTNQDLGVVSFDRRVTLKKEREFLRTVVNGVRDNEIVSVAAFDGGVIVGHCDVRRRRPSDVRHTGVLGIVILDGYRGLGIGKRMMTEALNGDLRIGVWLVELQVFAINDIAIHLYEKLGFRKVGIVPNKMIRGSRHYDEIAMYNDLRNQ